MPTLQPEHPKSNGPRKGIMEPENSRSKKAPPGGNLEEKTANRVNIILEHGLRAIATGMG